MVHGTVLGCEIITSDLPLTRANHLMWVQFLLASTFAALLFYVLLALLTDSIVFNFGGSSYVFGSVLVVLAIVQGISFPIWKRQVSRNEPDPTNPDQSLDLVGKPMLREVAVSVWLSTLAVGFTVWILLSFTLRLDVFPWAFTLPTEVTNEFFYLTHLNALLTGSFAALMVLVRAVFVHWNPVATVTSLKKDM